MGNTIIQFRDQQFVANDYDIEMWLHFLVRAMESLDLLPDWLGEARELWEFVAQGHTIGVSDPRLDEFLLMQAQIDFVLELCAKAFMLLNEFGEVIPDAYIDRLTRGWDLPGDFKTDYIRPVAANFVSLLKGELAAASAKNTHD